MVSAGSDNSDMASKAQQSALLAEIDAKIGEVRTEAIDLSFGEILNLKKSLFSKNTHIKLKPKKCWKI